MGTFSLLKARLHTDSFHHRESPFARPNGQCGATVVEVALTLFIFIAALVTCIDAARICYAATSLQYGAYRGARYASLLASNPGYTREQSILRKIREHSFVDVQPNELTFCTFDSIDWMGSTTTPCTGPSPLSTCKGARVELLQVSHPVRLILGLQLTLTATVPFMNEPWGTGAC